MNTLEITQRLVVLIKTLQWMEGAAKKITEEARRAGCQGGHGEALWESILMALMAADDLCKQLEEIPSGNVVELRRR